MLIYINAMIYVFKSLHFLKKWIVCEITIPLYQNWDFIMEIEFSDPLPPYPC